VATYAESLHDSVMPPPTLWHYTTKHGLLSIISKKSLWATKIHYLNDSSEFSYALRLAGKILEERIAREQCNRERLEAFHSSIPNVETINVCVASFSEPSDDLSQWRAYCGAAGGHSIGFASAYLRVTARENQFFLTKCRYIEADQCQLINDLIDRCLSEPEGVDVPERAWYFPARLARLTPVLKDSSFAGEQEWRLISQPKMFSEMCFREGKSMLVPYAKFELTGDINTYIASVTVGPTPNLALSVASTAGFLLSKGLKDAKRKILQSNIPYRSW
jgi:hypothetical protein